MRRLLVAVATALTVPAAAMVAVAAGPASASTVSAARDDDKTVCAATAKTVTGGLDTFVADMQNVSKLASGGDLTGAQDAVKDAGATLVDLSDKLADDAAKAETPKLKDTVTQLSTEFETLGKSLTDLSSLETFDTTKLDALAKTMSDICGPEVGSSLLPSPTTS